MKRINWKAIEWSKQQQLETNSFSKDEIFLKIKEDILKSTPEELYYKIKKAVENDSTVSDFLKEFEKSEN